jgi:transposase
VTFLFNNLKLKLMRTKVSNKSFNGQSFYVGIDVHKKSWKVTILGEEREHKIMSQDPVAELLASYLKRNFPGGTYHAVYEAGFSGFKTCRRLRDLGVDCKVIHPADVSTNQKERLQKTDKADSRKLAQELRKNDFEAIHVPDPELEADRALVRQRFRLVKDVARTKNRVKSLLFQFGIDIPDRFTESQTRHWSKVYLNWLKGLELEHESLRQTLDNYLSIGGSLRKELLSVNRQVRKLSQTDAYKNNYELLLSIPGIGLHTAMTFLVQFGDMKRFDCLDDLCSYVGLIPRMHGSGDKMWTGKMVKRGRKELKIMLVEASWKAISIDPALMAKYNELKKRMERNKAIIRIARKMLSRIRYVLLHQQKYEMGIVK